MALNILRTFDCCDASEPNFVYRCGVPLNIMKSLHRAYIILPSRQSFQQVVMGLVIMGFLHFKMGIVQPLVYPPVFVPLQYPNQEISHAQMIQSILSPIKLYKVYIKLK